MNELFTIGQVVYAKVLDKCHGDKQEILLSLLPEDINSDIDASLLMEGNVLSCAVEEEEDHGYLLESGLKNIRAFLPKKNVKGSSSLSIGDHIFCKVQKITESSIILNMFKKNEPMKIDTIEVPNMKTLMPGCVVDFNIAQILKNGVEGLLFDGSVTAYVSELYIPSKYSLNDSQIIGKELQARILYTMPFSNQIFATLTVDEMKTRNVIRFGTLIEQAKVLKQTSSGVLVKLNANARGIILRKNIVKKFKSNFDLESTMMKFTPNSVHQVRVMDYNILEDLYLCTNDSKLLKEKYFSTYDLTLGQFAQAKVEEKINDGYRLSIGNVRAYLKGVFLNKTSKIKVGDDLKVRVFEVDHYVRLVQVTNLPGFLHENSKILKSKKDIKFQESYTGIIINESAKLYEVLFFNHIKGVLIKNEDLTSELLTLGGLSKGSVKNFQVKTLKGDRITLEIPKIVDTTNLGKVFMAKVTALLPTGVQVYINDLKMYGKILINLLSEFPQLAPHVHENLKENEKFEVVSLGNNLFSRRDVEYYKSGVIDDFNNLVPGDIIRGSIKSVNDEIVELECPLKNFNQTIRLNRNAFDDFENVELRQHDIVYVNVIAKNESHQNSLYVTPALHKVWKNEMETSMCLVKSYLTDVDFILDKQKQSGKPHAKYTIGQRISGKIKSNFGTNLLMETEYGVFAQGSDDNASAYKVGSQIKDAVVVWIDPVTALLHITLKDKYKNDISIDQTVDPKLVNEKKHKAVVVYFNEFVTVASIRKNDPPLIYAPSKLHYNDFSTKLHRSIGISAGKIVIKKVAANHLLGVFTHDYKIYEKMEKYITKLGKRKSSIVKMSPKKIVKVDVDDEDTVVADKKDGDDDEDRKTESESEGVGDELTVVENTSNGKVSKNKPKDVKSKDKREKSFGKSAMGTLRKAKMKIPLKKLVLTNKDSLINDNVVKLVSVKSIKDGGKNDKINDEKPIKKLKPKKKSFAGKFKLKTKRLSKK